MPNRKLAISYSYYFAHCAIFSTLLLLILIAVVENDIPTTSQFLSASHLLTSAILICLFQKIVFDFSRKIITNSPNITVIFSLILMIFILNLEVSNYLIRVFVSEQSFQFFREAYFLEVLLSLNTLALFTYINIDVTRAAIFPQLPLKAEENEPPIQNESSKSNELFRQKYKLRSERDALLVTELRNRAEKLTRFGGLIIFIIVGVLLFGAGVVVFAGVFTAFGTSRVDIFAQSKLERGNLKQEISAIDSSISEYLENITNFRTQNPNFSVESCIIFSSNQPQKQVDDIASQAENITNTGLDSNNRPAKSLEIFSEKILSINDEKKRESLLKNIRDFCRQVNQYENALKTRMQLNAVLENIDKGIGMYFEKALSQQAGTIGVTPSSANIAKDTAASDFQILVTSSITRFGILAIIIFLVQILVGLYRYNAMLAAYYRASADTLMLADGQNTPKRLSDLHEVLKPDVVYGRTPSSIPDNIAKALANLTSTVGKIQVQFPTPKNEQDKKEDAEQPKKAITDKDKAKPETAN